MIPPKKRIRRDDTIQIRPNFASKSLRLYREEEALFIGKTDSFASELFAINLVFGFQVID
jgi:hypothetical protein